ncbi:MAG: hypothetical protein CMJ89_10065 [Planctomycetes bacterium]|jgi:hypothetical protein|nr:hypothetical protein [Planctomycetota bacterium]
MKRAFLFPSLLVVLFSGCASTSENETPSATAREIKSPGKEARELDALERELGLARARLAKVELEQSFSEEQLETKIRHGKTEIGIAEAGLARFREVDGPNQLASEKLNLRTAKDRAQEAADELKQIEIMYKEQDLDDLTAEFVVSRGRRSAERAAARIVIQEGTLLALEERELPQKEQELGLALDKAISGLQNTEREGEIVRHGKAIALQEAENEIARLENELVALREKVEP